jgi:hypothetical protein
MSTGRQAIATAANISTDEALELVRDFVIAAMESRHNNAITDWDDRYVMRFTPLTDDVTGQDSSVITVNDAESGDPLFTVTVAFAG